MSRSWSENSTRQFLEHPVCLFPSIRILDAACPAVQAGLQDMGRDLDVSVIEDRDQAGLDHGVQHDQAAVPRHLPVLRYPRKR